MASPGNGWRIIREFAAMRTLPDHAKTVPRFIASQERKGERRFADSAFWTHYSEGRFGSAVCFPS